MLFYDRMYATRTGVTCRCCVYEYSHEIPYVRESEYPWKFRSRPNAWEKNRIGDVTWSLPVNTVDGRLFCPSWIRSVYCWCIRVSRVDYRVVGGMVAVCFFPFYHPPADGEKKAVPR